MRGAVVAGYGANVDGNRNDGINISVPEGTPIKAAENGVVIYSGSSLKELGNAVLVRHDDGTVTVYGNASELRVQRGQKVRVTVEGAPGAYEATVMRIGAAITEGNTGTVTLTLAVTLSAPAAQTVTLNYATANGTAAAGSDYTSTSGTLTFNPGVTTQNVTITVAGATLDEADEIILVDLSGATNATIGDSQGVATILDNKSQHATAPAPSSPARSASGRDLPGASGRTSRRPAGPRPRRRGKGGR